MKGKRFVHPNDAKTINQDWGKVKWISEAEITGAENFSVCVVLIDPEKGHLNHNHPGVEEILYFISGEGEQTVDGKTQKVGPGMLIHIPPDVYHQTMNTGWEPLKFVAVYSPAVTP